MGKLISIWSSTKKTGKSVFLYSLACRLSDMIDKKLQILVVCMNLKHGNLLSMFDIDKNELNIEDLVNFKIHPGNDFSLLNVLAGRGNMHIIGSSKTGSTYLSRNIKIYESLVEEFRQTFDLVLFDTLSGSENTLTNMIIDKSDYVINLVNQDKEVLDRYQFVTGKDMMYVINKYRDIYPDEKELASLYKLKNTFALPYCSDLQEMKNKGRLKYYNQHATSYNKKICEISKFMTDRLLLDLNEDPEPVKRKRSLLSGVLEGLIQ